MVTDRFDALIRAVKAKRGLSTLDDAYVREKLEKILRADERIGRKLDASKTVDQFLRSTEWDAVLKRIRKELRTVYGVFQRGSRDGILERFAKGEMKKEEAVREILDSHVSTKERLPYYPIIVRELVKRIVPAPRSIIDLGCGMNPLADEYFRVAGWKVRWKASDVSVADMDFLVSAFAKFGIEGNASRIDLLNEMEDLGSITGEVTFLLKLLDSLEAIERHVSNQLFDHITTPWIVVSFPTRSLGGKNRIATSGRSWFERLLTRKEMTWETFQVPNEIFYVIRRK